MGSSAQKVLEEEKRLALICKTGTEFFERYQTQFPKHRDLSGIAKIWDRRSSFRKTIIDLIPDKVTHPSVSTPDYESLYTEMLNRKAIEIDIQKDILTELKKQTTLFYALAKMDISKCPDEIKEMMNK
jgi:hypothetical protein